MRSADEEHRDKHNHGRGVETHRHLAEDAVVQPGDSEGDGYTQERKYQLLSERMAEINAARWALRWAL
jgi:hypothetical protein